MSLNEIIRKEPHSDVPGVLDSLGQQGSSVHQSFFHRVDAGISVPSVAIEVGVIV